MTENNGKPNLSFCMDAIGTAVDWTKSLLFRPFDRRKWAWLALIMFIVALGQGGGGGNVGNWAGDGSELGDAGAWIKDNLALFIALIILTVLFMLIVGLIFLYISSCFHFVFLDNIIKDRISIRESFGDMKGKGWSFFLFQLSVAVIVILFVAVVLAIPVILLLSEGTRVAGIVAIIIAILLILLVIIPVAAVMMFTKDFVLPIMYGENLSVLEGWSRLRKMISGLPVHFLAYFGARILIHIALGVIGFMILIALLIPFIIILLPVGGIFGLVIWAAGWSWYWLIVLVPVGILALIAFAYFYQFAILPLSAFSRYYPVVFLNGISEDFKLCPAFDVPQEEL